MWCVLLLIFYKILYILYSIFIVDVSNYCIFVALVVWKIRPYGLNSARLNKINWLIVFTCIKNRIVLASLAVKYKTQNFCNQMNNFRKHEMNSLVVCTVHRKIIKFTCRRLPPTVMTIILIICARSKDVNWTLSVM